MSKMSLYTLHTCKTGKKRSILYEKLCMKVYLDDEKTHVNPYPQMVFSVGWTVLMETIVLSSYSREEGRNFHRTMLH